MGEEELEIMNKTGIYEKGETITASDCAWILNNAFLILTMQSGFGLLEVGLRHRSKIKSKPESGTYAGYVNSKNVANIMVKNAVDVCFGGIGYWAFGYGLSFGRPSNWFCGFGDFFADFDRDIGSGSLYTKYVFQFSFATASTTIVSGSIAERMKLSAYIAFSALNTFVYVFPASWAWNHNEQKGFLKAYGFHDMAGASVVHVTGGASALVCALMLGPRSGRFNPGGKQRYRMSSPVTALTGLFMLWWAWLAFNCGSTFGIDNSLWKLAAKVGLNTVNGSIGGGITGILLSLLVSKGRIYDINTIITGILSGLVGVTAGCGVLSPAYSIIMGAVCAIAAILFEPLKEKLQIDDPVGAINVHLVAATLSTIGVGFFGEDRHFGLLKVDQVNRSGLFITGEFSLLAVQTIGVLLIAIWSMLSTIVIYFLIDKTIGMRVTLEEEFLGADFCEHRIHQKLFVEKLEYAILSSVKQANLNHPNADADMVMQNVVDHLVKLANKTEKDLLTLEEFFTNYGDFGGVRGIGHTQTVNRTSGLRSRRVVPKPEPGTSEMITEIE